MSHAECACFSDQNAFQVAVLGSRSRTDHFIHEIFDGFQQRLFSRSVRSPCDGRPASLASSGHVELAISRQPDKLAARPPKMKTAGLFSRAKRLFWRSHTVEKKGLHCLQTSKSWQTLFTRSPLLSKFEIWLIGQIGHLEKHKNKSTEFAD